MTAKRRPFRHLFWVLGFALLVGSAVGAGAALNSPRGGPAAPTGKEPAAPGAEAVCMGFVDVPAGVTPLYPVRHGQVIEVRARANRTYRKGEVLLVIDSEDARRRLKEAEEDLALAGEQLAQAEKLPRQEWDEKIKQQKLAIKAAKATLEAAEAELNYRQSQRKLIGAALIATREALVKKAQVAVEVEKAKLGELKRMDVEAKARLARKLVAAKEAQVRRARLAVEKCSLRAPFAGKVLRVLASAGETLGSQPRQPALWFCPTGGGRIIRAEVDQEFAGRVAVGKSAIIEDDTRVSKQWHGKVLRLSDWYTQRRSILVEPLQYNDVRTLECIVSLDKAGQRELRIGQRVRVTIGRAE
jgi:multidrug resistance efflux pump